MAKPVLVVGGHGPGISEAVAKRFLREGWQVALLARTAGRLEAAAAALGADARAWPVDLGDPEAVTACVAAIRSGQGAIGAIQWTAYSSGAGDLLAAPVAELRAQLDVGVLGLVAAVQAALPDLEAAKGSVLVAGGGLSTDDPKVAAMAVQWGASGLAVAKAAQHKACALLAEALRPRGVHVAELVVMGGVKGTAFDRGQPGLLDAAQIAERFYGMHVARDEHAARYP